MPGNVPPVADERSGLLAYLAYAHFAPRSAPFLISKCRQRDAMHVAHPDVRSRTRIRCHPPPAWL